MLEPILKLGEIAPSFSLTDQQGAMRSLADYLGKWVVIYFSPRDEVRPCCPVAAAGSACAPCTQEPTEFHEAAEQLREMNAVVIGVARNGATWHYGLALALDQGFPLLIDRDLAMSTAYGGWREREIRGAVVPSMTHSTVIVGPDGRVARTWPKYMTEGHVADVLAALRELQASSLPARDVDAQE